VSKQIPILFLKIYGTIELIEQYKAL